MRLGVMPPVRILVVHAQRTLSAALGPLLERQPDLRVAGTVPSATAARAAVDTLHPDVVVIGMDLEDAEDGLELAAGLAERPGGAPGLVILSDAGDDLDAAVASVRAGAVAFVPSDAATSELVEAIRSASQGHGSIPSRLLGGVLRRLARPDPAPAPEAALFERLTDRETEILQLLVGGLDRAGIARELHLSPNTVRTHVGNILRKLEVHSTLEAVTLAYASGVRADTVEQGNGP